MKAVTVVESGVQILDNGMLTTLNLNKIMQTAKTWQTKVVNQLDQ